MARPLKTGLDYFPIDCNMDSDDKIAIIEADYGNTGFAIIIKLFMRIYGQHGYYTMMTLREQKLFSKRINVDINLLNDVINSAIQEGIFDKSLYGKFGVLTSSGIQKRYIEAIERRKQVCLIKSLILIELPVNPNIKLVNVDINSVNENTMYAESTQTKVKKTKVKERNNIEQKFGVFDLIWEVYPNKKGKGKVSKKKKDELEKIGFDILNQCLERYKQSKPSWQDWMHGSTFLNSGYIDYLDANYQETKTKQEIEDEERLRQIEELARRKEEQKRAN